MAGINSGLFAARAGISSNGLAISVLADNITNANTTGYKASRADFSDMLSSSLGAKSGGGVTVGQGSQVQAVTQIFNQGAFEFTGRGLDLGIAGNGFFILSNDGQRLYTRAGNFKVDSDGFLLDQNGFQVQGFPTGGAGGLEALNVNSVSQSSAQTSAVTIAGNIDATSTNTTIPTPPPALTFSALSNAASFSTFVDVFDSLGAKHTVTVYFYKTAASTWTARGYVDAGEVGGTAGDPSQIGTAAITFDSSGQRTSVPAADWTATPAWSNGASSDPISFLFDPLTQFAAPSAINSITQDGTGVGNVVSFSVGSDGALFASLDNGETTSVGTIALANFANPEGLSRNGNSVYAATSSSGDAIVGTPDTGRFGSIQSGALELSTADIADDFVKLIQLQRGFQGSSRLIGTINDLLSEIVNLVR